MSYRNDQDALEAREAALKRELQQKQREHDEVADLLAEAHERDAVAKLDPDVMTGNRTLRRVMIVASIALVAAGTAAFFLVQRTDDASRVLTCQQVQPEYWAAEGEAFAAYERARAAKGLTPITLELRSISRARDAEPPETLDKALGQVITPWHQFTYEVDGRQRPAIASEIFTEGMPNSRTAEFVNDANGGVWRVKRAPHVRPIKTRTVEACQWGCWGGPPNGTRPKEFIARTIWLLPDGSTYRGEVEIAYDAPKVIINYIGPSCPLPP